VSIWKSTFLPLTTRRTPQTAADLWFFMPKTLISLISFLRSQLILSIFVMEIWPKPAKNYFNFQTLTKSRPPGQILDPPLVLTISIRPTSKHVGQNYKKAMSNIDYKFIKGTWQSCKWKIFFTVAFVWDGIHFSITNKRDRIMPYESFPLHQHTQEVGFYVRLVHTANCNGSDIKTTLCVKWM